jgi:hypothetical protein
MRRKGHKKEGRKKSVTLCKSSLEKSLDSGSYDMWVFEHYIKERLKALGVIQ